MILDSETAGGWISISFVWCQCTAATIDELIMTMTAFQHKYSNVPVNTRRLMWYDMQKIKKLK